MLPGIDRVYVNHRALKELAWRPRYDFGHVLGCLRRGEDVFSPLARTVGSKGYHPQSFGQQPYPVESGGYGRLRATNSAGMLRCPPIASTTYCLPWCT